MILETILPWLIPCIQFPALYLLGNKKKVCFIMFSMGNVLWIIVSVIDRRWGAVLSLCVYTIFNIRNYIKWRNDEKQSRSKKKTK